MAGNAFILERRSPVARTKGAEKKMNYLARLYQWREADSPESIDSNASIVAVPLVKKGEYPCPQLDFAHG
jgi:hypothetical protein